MGSGVQIRSEMAGGSNIQGEEEVMFAKKPLGGWSCASCEKDIVNMYGNKADYYPWMKLPVRDANERISKVG